MARQARIQPAGGHYHVCTRGTARAAIFCGDEDRRHFVRLLADVVDRYGWHLYAYCLMDNHYHLALTTPDRNLGAGMGRLNQIYAQWFNHRHNRVGHLFQARYWSQLLEDEAHVLALVRYIAQNPVRAGLCACPEDWRWSSARATAGLVNAPRFLDVAWVHRTLGADTGEAAAIYLRLVANGDSPQ